MLVLLWGFETDPPLLAVREQLRILGTPSVLVDQRFVLDTDVNLQVGEEIEAAIQIGGCEIDLANVTAAYIRPHDSHRGDASNQRPVLHLCRRDDAARQRGAAAESRVAQIRPIETGHCPCQSTTRRRQPTKDN